MKRFFTIAFMLVSIVAFSQGRLTVRGSVKDMSDAPVAGAVVMLDGSASVGHRC